MLPEVAGATASRPTLRISATHMLEMELLDADDPSDPPSDPASDTNFAHACGRRLGFEAMLPVSEFAVTSTAKHTLLHQDAVFDFDGAGKPTRCS